MISIVIMRFLLILIIFNICSSKNRGSVNVSSSNSTCTGHDSNATCKLPPTSSTSSYASYASSFSSSSFKDLISKRNLTSHFQNMEERDQRKLEHFNKVKRFTNYFLYFNNDYKPYNNLNNNNHQSYYYNNNENNETHRFFMNHINRCVRYKYSPRLLSSNQISWKSTKSSDNNVNSTTSKSAKNTTGEIVHEYLIFAMLLPKHPFSSDLYHAIKAVAPMFPTITFVIGDGFEFTEMCQQYNIRSFPKLLFFKRGILKGRYNKEQNAESLAAQLSVWTESYPKALPARERRKKDDIEKYFKMWYNYDNIYDKILEFKDWRTISSISDMIKKNIAYNLKSLTSPKSSHLEPVVGLFDWASSYEIYMIIIAGIYTLLRFIYSFFKNEDVEENNNQPIE